MTKFREKDVDYPQEDPAPQKSRWDSRESFRSFLKSDFSKGMNACRWIPLFLLKGACASYRREWGQTSFEKSHCAFTIQLSTASLVRFYNLDKCLETTIHLIKALTRQYNEIINILQSVSISYLRACMSTMANTWVSWVSLVKASENYIIPELQSPVHVQAHLIAVMNCRQTLNKNYANDLTTPDLSR